MISAIVYNSNAGHTKKYAEMLSESIMLPIFTIDDAKKLLPKHSEIIYLSWVKNNELVKFSKVNKYFDVKIVGVVSITTFNEANKQKNFIGYNNIKTDKVFFLRGGIDLRNLTEKEKTQVVSYGKKLKESIIKNNNCTADNYEFVDIFENGRNFVTKGNLSKLITCYKLA